MRRAHRSIRSKFFFALSAAALVFIGVLLALNLFFFEDYYRFMRRSELRDAYESIRSRYDGSAEEIAAVLDRYESQTAIRLAIVRHDGTVLYASFFSPDDDAPQDPFALPYLSVFDQQRRGYAVLQAIAHDLRWAALVRPGYQFMNVSLRDDDQYLCLAGALDENARTCLFAYMPYAYIQQNSMLNLLFLLIAGGCALLICLVFAYLVSRQFTRPLIEMAGLADRMSELDFSTKYTGFGRHEDAEVAQLGQSLNRLSTYLEQAIGELQRSNAQLAQEILEKERIDDMRREFIANVSHELKTPIALIQGYAEGLTAGVADDPEDRKFYCDTIADEASHMNKLVMQLLSLSRLERGAEQTFCEEVDLHALCAAAVRKTAVLCESRGLTVDYADTQLTIRTDGDLLEQVLMNYLSNAIRYTADGGHIAIAAARADGRIRLTVFNEGNGLPEAELPRIWEKFYRTDRARTRAAGGTGIGLSLVRAIADALHGQCGAENAPGGIVFWFALPDPPAQQPR